MNNESGYFLIKPKLWQIFLTWLLLFSSNCYAEQFPLGILGATGKVVAGQSDIEITSVGEDSPAELAGVSVGDRITGIGDQPFGKHTSNIDDGGNGPQRTLGEALDTVAAIIDPNKRKLVLNLLRSKEKDQENDTIRIACALPYRPSVLQKKGRMLLMDRAAAQLRKTCVKGSYWDAPAWGLTGDRVLTAWVVVALKALNDSKDKELLNKCRVWLRGPNGRCWVPDDPMKQGPASLGNWALTGTAVALVEMCDGKPGRDDKQTLEVICKTLQQRMNENGLFGHDVSTGYGGKGFNVINTLSHLAWAMGAKAGVPIDQTSWELSLDQIKKSVDPDGGIRYWSVWKTGTADASLRTASMALGMDIAGQEPELFESFSKYLDEHRARTREAHAVGTLGMMLAPAALWRHDKAAYQRFLKEWRWYLALMQDHRGKINYIGGKGNNGGDSYLGMDRIICVVAIMIVAPPEGNLMLFDAS